MSGTYLVNYNDCNKLPIIRYKILLLSNKTPECTFKRLKNSSNIGIVVVIFKISQETKNYSRNSS